MTRDRDIERVLETWLRDGSTEMPDRVFDTVLDRVGRQPQRPLARIQLRVRDMTPFLRVAAIAAVLIVALGAGYALLLRPTTPRVGSVTPAPITAPSVAPRDPSAAPSTSSSSVPSSGTVALPAELVGGWIAPERAIPALGGSGSGFLVLAIDAEGFTTARINLTGNPLYVGRTSSLQQDSTVAGRLTIHSNDRTTVGSQAVLCRSADVGEYTWAVDGDGRTLRLEAVRDDCAARLQAFSGAWTRADCRDAYLSACLGDVPAGIYSSHVFDPRARSASAAWWTGVDGALRYTVPAGWANSQDWADSFDLVTADAYATADVYGELATSHGIYLRAGPIAAVQNDGCTYVAALFPRSSMSDLSAWLLEHPGLDVSSPTSMTIDGHPATMLDIAVDQTWTKTCPDVQSGGPMVELFTGGAPDAWTWGIGGDLPEHQRIILVDLGSDSVVLIAIDDTSAPSRFDELVTGAMPIVESLQFPD
jgi:hypothetical protein